MRTRQGFLWSILFVTISLLFHPGKSDVNENDELEETTEGSTVRFGSRLRGFDEVTSERNTVGPPRRSPAISSYNPTTFNRILKRRKKPENKTEEVGSESSYITSTSQPSRTVLVRKRPKPTVLSDTQSTDGVLLRSRLSPRPTTTDHPGSYSDPPRTSLDQPRLSSEQPRIHVTSEQPRIRFPSLQITTTTAIPFEFNPSVRVKNGVYKFQYSDPHYVSGPPEDEVSRGEEKDDLAYGDDYAPTTPFSQNDEESEADDTTTVSPYYRDYFGQLNASTEDDVYSTVFPILKGANSNESHEEEEDVHTRNASDITGENVGNELQLNSTSKLPLNTDSSHNLSSSKVEHFNHSSSINVTFTNLPKRNESYKENETLVFNGQNGLNGSKLNESFIGNETKKEGNDSNSRVSSTPAFVPSKDPNLLGKDEDEEESEERKGVEENAVGPPKTSQSNGASFPSSSSSPFTPSPPVNYSIKNESEKNGTTEKSRILAPTSTTPLSHNVTKWRGSEKPTSASDSYSWFNSNSSRPTQSSEEKSSEEEPTEPTSITTTTIGVPSMPSFPGQLHVETFIVLKVWMEVSSFCNNLPQFKSMILDVFPSHMEVEEKQLVLRTHPKCDENLSGEGGNNVTVFFYLTNKQNSDYSEDLTREFKGQWAANKANGIFLHRVGSVEMVISSSGGRGASSDENSVIIWWIILASAIAASLFLLAIVLLVMRHRQAKSKFAKRCTPVSLDDYSLDNISVFNSFRRKRVRHSKRSYTNAAFDDPNGPSRSLNGQTLNELVGDGSKVGELEEEFREVPNQNASLDDIPNGAEVKNRYANVIPLPDSRVLLTFQDDQHSDYINANYVRGFMGSNKSYIITQGPLEETMVDFWRMVWEQQIRVIFMLTDFAEAGIAKCAEYYPRSETIDCSQLHGDFQVTLEKKDIGDNFITSYLVLKDMERSLRRDVIHLWYHSWPETGVPQDPKTTVDFLVKARKYTKENAPILVHCSPGTGRSGTIVACDISMKEFESNGTLDIPKCVSRIRTDRAGAVQTKEQYLHIYRVLAAFASGTPPEQKSNENDE